MKQLLLLFILLFQSLYCFSQISITHTQSVDSTTNVTRIEYDTTGFLIGASGANVLWDYSNLSGSAAVGDLYIHDTNSYCFSDTFNIREYDNAFIFPGWKYHYYFLTNNNLTYRGYCEYDNGSFSSSLNFSDPELIMPFPFNYMDSFSDSASGDLFANHLNYDRKQLRTGNYDAYGELRIPGKIFPNTGRVKFVTTTVDTMITSQVYTRVFERNETSYEWYDLSNRGPVFRYTYIEDKITTNGIATYFYTTDLESLSSAATSVSIEENPEDESILQLFPNPSSGIINIKVPESFRHNGTGIFIYGVQGNLIYERDAIDFSKELEVDLGALSKGLYLVNVSDGKTSIISKISLY